MVRLLHQAVWGRARLIVQDAAGLGPWTEAGWARCPPRHRHPADGRGRPREEHAWLAVLDRLGGDTDVTGRPEWRRRIDGLLRDAAHELCAGRHHF
jgi:hypothetical protein